MSLAEESAAQSSMPRTVHCTAADGFVVASCQDVICADVSILFDDIWGLYVQVMEQDRIQNHKKYLATYAEAFRSKTTSLNACLEGIEKFAASGTRVVLSSWTESVRILFG